MELSQASGSAFGVDCASLQARDAMAASSGDKAMQILVDAAESEGLAIDLLTNLVKDTQVRKGIFKKVISMVRKQKMSYMH